MNFGVNLAGASDPVRAQASAITGGMLQMLGIQPLIGRLITPADDAPNGPVTAVLSYGLMAASLRRRPPILGRDIRLNGSPCTVVGVMPKSFAFPPGDPNPPELWTPLQLDPARPGGRGSHYLSILARRKPAVSMVQATAEMQRYTAHPRVVSGPGNSRVRPQSSSHRAGRFSG